MLEKHVSLRYKITGTFRDIISHEFPPCIDTKKLINLFEMKNSSFYQLLNNFLALLLKK